MVEANSSPALSEQSLYSLGAGIACAIVIGYLASAAHLPTAAQETLASTGLALPAAIAYQLHSRRRNPAADIADIRRQGWPQRPVGLVVALFAAALLLADSIGGVLLFASGANNDTGASMVILAILGVGMAFISARASHYLTDRPYLWTLAAVGLTFVLRLLILAMAWHAFTADMGDEAPPLSSEIPLLFLGYAILLPFCLAGVFFGRRRHDQFVAAKMAKLERSGQTQQQPIATLAPPRMPAAWYADPDGLQNIDRWWDGAQWTDRRRNRPA